MRNKLLQRQVQKHFGSLENIPPEFSAFLKVICESYEHYEKDRNMLERSIDLTSAEMIELNDKLRKESAEVKAAHYNLRTLFENVKDFFFSLKITFENGKPQFTPLQMSPACQDIYGYPSEVFFTNPTLWLDVTIEEDKAILGHHFPLLTKGESIAHDYRIYHKDGSVRWITTKITPTLDSSGKLVRIDGVTHDINDKKLSEQKLEQALRQLHAVFNNIDDVLYSVDMVTYNLIQMSAACERVFGYSSEEFLTQPDLWQRIIHPDDLHISQEQVKMLYKGHQVFNQYRIIHRDGKIRWIENKIIPTLDATGNLIRLDGLSNDITSKRDNAQKLQESEVRFRSLIENSADMLTMLSAEGIVLYESPAVIKTLGYLPQENAGRSGYELIHPDDRNMAAEAHIKVLKQEGKPVHLALRTKTKSGKYIFVEGNVTNLLNISGVNAIVSNFRDVTKRVEAEQNLSESQNRYRMVYENPFLGIAIGTIDGILQNVNHAFCKMLGYTQAELCNQHFSMFTPPDDTEKELPYIVKMAKGEIDTYQIEKRYVKKSGEFIWVELSISCVKNPEGEIQYVVAVVQDITPKRTAEESLLKSEANLRNILENTDTSYVLLNKNKIILSYNHNSQEQAIQSIGHPLVEGKNYVDLMRKERQKDVNEKINKVIENGEKINYEVKYSKDGLSDTWISVSMHPILANNKKVLGLSIASTDITGRKNAEQIIRQSNERYGLVTKATNDVIWDWDIVNNKIYRSENYKQVFGHHEADDNFYIHSTGTHTHPDDIERILNSISEKIEDPNSSLWEGEYRYYRSNGEMAYVQDRGYIIHDENQKPVRMVGAMRDITAEKVFAIERDKITSDLIRQNKNLEQFAYIVSHNLRAPLANITGLSRIIQTPKLDIKARKISMEGLVTSVKRLDDVIIDLTNILQVKREIDEKRESISFPVLLKDIRQSVHNLIKEENVTIISDFSVVDHVFSVKSYMYSIFYNLILNSIKYKMPARRPVIEISGRKTESKVILSFKDNGSGIDLERYGDKIFGLYKRFHYDVEGKGMGLFMVKTQVESLEGSISVKSRLNEGTEFIIEFDKTLMVTEFKAGRNEQHTSLTTNLSKAS
ncbi:MAG: PAS domain S-box protein [Bacteroidota bacterium]|nr:PAS domain S-box protein [Bacteroidota bacterium]